MPRSVEENLHTILKVLAEQPRDNLEDAELSGEQLATLTQLSHPEINDAVTILVETGRAEWLQVMGTAPYIFASVWISPRGRMEYERLNRQSKKVFVVHGRNETARRAMFSFLRAVGLEPIEWAEAVSLTGEGSPYVGQVLDHAFSIAQAVIVLITGDDVARLGTRYLTAHDPPYEREFTAQARPNVLFEAGLAFGRNPERTILVVLGDTRPFSDIAGRHTIHMGNNPAKRQELADRLRTAGCTIDLTGRSDWYHEGDFDSSVQTPDM